MALDFFLGLQIAISYGVLDDPVDQEWIRKGIDAAKIYDFDVSLSDTDTDRDGIPDRMDPDMDDDDYLLYNTATGALSYDADGNGTGAAVQFAVGVNVHPVIAAADFLIV